MREITYADAIREAMSEEMRRDENVFFMGEDIGVYNGAFGVSKGMIQEFGEERVRETPISETGFVGAGVGAAMMGMRPIVELMFSDFISVCWDQIMNEAAKTRFMLGGAVSVPMVLRTASGGGTGAAAQHSQSLENLYAHIPGLKLVIPSTPYDAKGLLKSAIRDDNTVIFLEQKKLYRTKGEVPDGEYTIPLGSADIKRSGADLTIVTYGRMVQMCMDVAGRLASEGIDAEVIDIRSLVPIDRNTIIESVKKTHRAVIVHEAVEFSGYGAEISAQISGSDAFFHLDAPIERVGGIYAPIPFNPNLEASVFPTPERIESAVRSVMRYSGNRQTGAVGLAVAAPVRITPLARRIAESAGADIRLASGSGRDGKIFSRDLTVPEAVSMAAREGAEASAGVSEGAGAAAGTEVEAGAKKIPMNGMRRVIARRMAKSASETAAVTQYVETDITELVSICDAANKGRGRGERITVTAYILRAMAIAVGEHERFRMRLAEGEKAFILREGVNIGVAVGTDDGLTVPVLRDADGLDVAGISAEVRSMAERARTGMLLPDECRGGVITLSNMGMHGVAAFTPIINQPEASILGIGAPTEKVVPCGDGFAFRSVVTQSLTYDHRIINGTEAAAFQLRIKELLEHPEQLARQAESASGKFNQQ